MTPLLIVFFFLFLINVLAIDQVKKRAVLDLIGGMRNQGLRYAKSSTPAQASDMLHVMALVKPFSADRLAGFDDACVLAGGDGSKGAASHVADVMKKADKYCLRGLSELSRLRLEAGAPVSRDMTRREAEVTTVVHGCCCRCCWPVSAELAIAQL